MSTDFRGSGVRFPIVPNAYGVLEWIDGDENVLQSLRLLLSTVTTERAMRPEFGTRAIDFVFEGDSAQNLHRLEKAIEEAIKQFEPRVAVESTTSRRDEARPGVVEVAVTVRVLRTNTLRNLVFPFYLDDAVSGL
jgi:uncharacterized protein